MKFNTTKTNSKKTTNYEGTMAYKLSAAMELYTAVVTSALENQFYEKGIDKLVRIQELIKKNDPVFVAKLAIYAREKMHLRSVPLVLTVELAKIHTGDSLVKDLAARVIQRADEITELLAYYSLSNNRQGTKKLNRLSKQIQKGIALAFNKFDEYQFAKYNRKSDVTLKDALFLSHPKAKNQDQQAVFDKLVQDTLSIPYTWETELSALGQQKFENETDKKKAIANKWEELIGSGKLGYMALMRNLRNIIQANVNDQSLQLACATIANEHKAQRAKQLPFRFLAAYREILKLNLEESVEDGLSSFFPNTQQIRALLKRNELVHSDVKPRRRLVLDALEEAAQYSAANVKGFDYNTRVLIACDVSGSMQQPISRNSKIVAYDIGLMLGMLLKSKTKNTQIGLFGDTWKTIDLPTKNILDNVQEMYKREGEVGYSTNGHLVIEDLIRKNQIVDKIMIFTDCQIWNSRGYYGGTSSATLESTWKRYKKIAPNAKIYVFDLMGYGQAPLQIKNDAFLIAGWSDKIFEVLDNLEKGGQTLDAIKQIEI